MIIAIIFPSFALWQALCQALYSNYLLFIEKDLRIRRLKELPRVSVSGSLIPELSFSWLMLSLNYLVRQSFQSEAPPPISK